MEPEFNILWPDGVGMINARMTSDKGTIVDRLYDYVDQIEATFDRFANAPIDVACFGCTGASYLIGQAREAEICETILRNRGYPFVTAARPSVTLLWLWEPKESVSLHPILRI